MNKERINLIISSRILSDSFYSSPLQVWRFYLYFSLVFLLVGINRPNLFENRKLRGRFGHRMKK